MEEKKEHICEYCGAAMKKWSVPPSSTWDVEFFWVCFNDECSYFVKGWEWMKKSREVNCSYRHSVHPRTGIKSPLPVWSKDALKCDIISE